jgi:hypothetical protein
VQALWKCALPLASRGVAKNGYSTVPSVLGCDVPQHPSGIAQCHQDGAELVFALGLMLVPTLCFCEFQARVLHWAKPNRFKLFVRADGAEGSFRGGGRAWCAVWRCWRLSGFLSADHPHELGMRVWNSCVVAGARTAFCRAFSVEVEAIVERIQRPCQSSSAGEGAIRETCVKGGSLYDSQLMMEKPQKYLTSGFVQYIIFTTHASRSRRRGDGQSPRHA